MMRLNLILFLAVCLPGRHVIAHPGGLDANGGHHMAGGGYHFHGSSNSYPVMPMYNMESFGYRSDAPIEPRRKARTQAKKPKPVKEKMERETARYQFHDAKTSPYLAVEFEDDGDYWKTITTSNKSVNHKKSSIIRIEALLDKNDPRTWIDKSGKYQIVGSLIKHEGANVELKKLSGDTITLNDERLSEYDNRFLVTDFEPKTLK